MKCATTNRTGYHRLANVAFWIIAFVGVDGVASQPPGASSGGEQPPAPPATSLPSERKWVDFEVILGRLTVRNPRHMTSQCAARGEEGDDFRELFSVTVDGVSASVHYEWSDQGADVVVDFAQGDDLTIECKPRGQSTAPVVRIRQQPGCHLFVTLGEGAQKRIVEAESLWHLLLAERELSQRFLLPILHRLRPHWRLEHQAKQLEEALIHTAGSEVLQRRRQWKMWVDQLRSPQFQERQQADLRLRSAGHAVLSYLTTLDPSQLDAEQRLRIRRIQGALAIHEGDTPQRMAAWYALDKPIWMALLTHGDPAKRLTAAEHLSRICGRDIDFRPLADPSERQSQLEKLRTNLAGE